MMSISTSRLPQGLPGWDDMSDLDRGAVLLHLWKRSWEGATYATAEYPCEYIEHPALLALTRDQACAHAVAVGVDDETVFDLLGETEHTRLYDLARTTGRQVLESRLLWGVRWANGEISPIERQDVAETHLADTRLAALELLHRDAPGGSWQVVRDMRGHEETVAVGALHPGDAVLRAATWVPVTSRTVTDDAVIVELATGEQLRADLGPATSSTETDPTTDVLRRRRRGPAPTGPAAAAGAS